MGPKKNSNAEKDRTGAAVDVDSETDDEELRQTIQKLQDQLKLANEEKNKERDTAAARQRELETLTNTLRRQENSAAIERDAIVREYQGRINELTALSETQSHRAHSPSAVNLQEQGAMQQPSQQASSAQIGIRGRMHTHPNYEVPMPRQALFYGKTSWESFFQPFEALAVACKWDQNEKLFRLTSCLRGEAAEYAFGQLPQDTLGNFAQLERALEARYKEKRTSSSYVAELENRRMQVKEKLADYVADIKRLVIKGYPTTDAQTREKINVRHFLKGLPDQQMAVAVGMREPASIDEARQILEMYNSLKDEVKSTRVRIVQPGEEVSSDSQFVTEKRLKEFGNEIKSNIGKKIDILSQKLDKSNGNVTRSKSPVNSRQNQENGVFGGARPRRQIRCYSCNGENHISRNCPNKTTQGNRRNGANNQEN